MMQERETTSEALHKRKVVLWISHLKKNLKSQSLLRISCYGLHKKKKCIPAKVRIPYMQDRCLSRVGTIVLWCRLSHWSISIDWHAIMQNHMLYVTFWPSLIHRVFDCCPGQHGLQICHLLKTSGHELLRYWPGIPLQ